MNRRAALAALGTAVVGGAMTGCTGGGRPARPARTGMRVATGSTMGVYFAYATAIAAVMPADLPVAVLTTAGSVRNLELLRSGGTDLAFGTADAVADAYRGRGAADGAPFLHMRAFGRLYDGYVHLCVPGDSPVESVADLAGRRVSVGPEGSGTTLIADRVLAVAGLDARADIVRSQLSLDDSVRDLVAGRIDAMFWCGGLPTPGIADLARRRWIRLVDLGGQALPLRSRFGAVYRTGAIPGRTYARNSFPVDTVAVPNLLVTTDALAVPTARDVVSTLFGNATRIGRSVPVAAQLDRRIAILTEPTPLHPAAAAYYVSAAVEA